MYYFIIGIKIKYMFYKYMVRICPQWAYVQIEPDHILHLLLLNNSVIHIIIAKLINII